MGATVGQLCFDAVVIVVMVDRNEVRFEGRDEPHPWVLRITEVFR